MIIQDLIALVNIIDRTFFVNFLSSIDHAVLGTSLLLYPKSFGFGNNVHPLEADDNSNTTDIERDLRELSTDLSSITTMASGTVFLAVFLYHILCLHDYRDEQVILRLKIINYMFQAVVTLGLVVLWGPTLWLMVRFVVDMIMIVWLALTFSRIYFAKSTGSFKSVQMALLLEMAYYVSIGYIALNFQSHAMTTNQPLTRQHTEQAKLHWQGYLHLFTMLFVLLVNVKRVPQADAKFLLIQNGLFLMALLLAIYRQDQGHIGPTTNMFVHTANQLFFFAHVLITYLVYKISSAGDALEESSEVNGHGQKAARTHEKEKAA